MRDDSIATFAAALLSLYSLAIVYLMFSPSWLLGYGKRGRRSSTARSKTSRKLTTKAPLAVLEFDVTAVDIGRGQRLSSTSCPICLALRRCYPQFAEVSVGKNDVLVMRCAVERIAGTPSPRYWHDEYAFDDMTRSKNLAFDAGQEIAPFRARLSYVRSLPADPPKRSGSLLQAAAEADAQPANVAGPSSLPAPASQAATAAPALSGPAAPYAPSASFYSVAAGDDNGDDDACGDLLALVGSWTPDDEEEDYGDGYDLDTFDLSGGSGGMGKHDLTALVERLDQFEERCGVRLEALSAFLDDDGSIGSYGLTVCGEVWVRKGQRLSRDIEISLVAYDLQARVVGKGEQQIESGRFNSFEAFEINAYVPVKALSKIRVLTR